MASKDDDFAKLIKITGDAYVSDLIIEAGYTKQSFPIEALKAWLEETIQEYDRLMDGAETFYARGRYLMQQTCYQEVLDKIQELEGEG